MVKTYSSNYTIKSLCYVKVPCLVQSDMLFLSFFCLSFFFYLAAIKFSPKWLLFSLLWPFSPWLTSQYTTSFIPFPVIRGFVLQALPYTYALILPCAQQQHWLRVLLLWPVLTDHTNVPCFGMVRSLPRLSCSCASAGLEHWPALKIVYCFPGFVFPFLQLTWSWWSHEQS